MDHVCDTMVPFINETDGVYGDAHSWKSIKEEKLIDPKEHEIISWKLNGKTSNYDYHK